MLAALREPASLVEGETGSGKTTQVAQYVLEDAAETGRPVYIICTQPRRISAIGVADRVAAERGERVGAGAVGYSIRGESRTCADTRLLFCTTGVLLRRLEEDPQLAGVTHVLVDEVHERTIEGDFLLMTLQGLLQDGRAGLSVCMMSATMDGDVLGEYFSGCPRVSFPGRAFPVKTFHLEDALELTRHRVDPGADWSRFSKAAERRRKSKAGDGEPPAPPTQQEVARRYPRHGPGVWEAMAALDPDGINVQLIVELGGWYVSCGGGVEAAMDALHRRRPPDGGYRADAKVPAPRAPPLGLRAVGSARNRVPPRWGRADRVPPRRGRARRCWCFSPGRARSRTCRRRCSARGSSGARRPSASG